MLCIVIYNGRMSWPYSNVSKHHLASKQTPVDQFRAGRLLQHVFVRFNKNFSSLDES